MKLFFIILQTFISFSLSLPSHFSSLPLPLLLPPPFLPCLSLLFFPFLVHLFFHLFPSALSFHHSLPFSFLSPSPSPSPISPSPSIEEAMVAEFPFEIPDEFSSMPLLKGRANVELKIVPKDNPNLRSVTLELVVDGYNAPVTAGNFVDLVQRKFYDGMEIQRADGFVIQTGDPAGPADGFIDPKTGLTRIVPLEVMVDGDKVPIYHDTVEELGRYKATMKLPFNAFGTMAMAREEFTNDSASSQVFWLLKESELTPSNANILDGRYAVFGYVVENQDSLADLKVGDVIESMKVTQGLDNLVNPSYK